MSMTAGTVTIANDESVSGAGMARALYDADVATMEALPTVPSLGATSAPWSAFVPVTQADIDTVTAARLATLREAARRATAYASGIVSYVTANAKARISTSTGGLQQVAAVDTDPPTATKDLPIV